MRLLVLQKNATSHTSRQDASCPMTQKSALASRQPTDPATANERIPMFNSFFGSLLSAPVLIALLGLLLRLWPTLAHAYARWVGSNMPQLSEIQKDTIKNTLIALMNEPGDHSEAVRYELSKLEQLHAHCWVMTIAEDYLEQHHPRTAIHRPLKSSQE